MAIAAADHDPSASAPRSSLSVCLFCGSSSGDDPQWAEAAEAFGRQVARSGARLVYGGGGVGLMGAAARSAHLAGAPVLGVMPKFLRRSEILYDDVETMVVATMHERKRAMFDAADAFAIFPGGVGTLEEAAEVLSWRRLDLHRKPIVFLDLNGFWRPLFELMRHMTQAGFAPTWVPDTWSAVDRVDDVFPAIEAMLKAAPSGPGFFGYEPEGPELSTRI